MTNNVLEQINNLGFIITDRQFGLEDENIKERAYITGFMDRDKARIFIKKFNSEFKKFAYSIVMTNRKNDLVIPLSLDKRNNTIVKSIQIFMSKQENQMNIHDKNMVYMVCYDNIWCNDAYSSNDGLFKSVINALS
jgi:hypothetical protein